MNENKKEIIELLNRWIRLEADKRLELNLANIERRPFSN